MNRVVKATVTRTNFLTSRSPYALQFLSLFKGVQFEPQPKQIRLVQQARVLSGSIQVRFRDSKHLKDIIEEVPLIRVIERLYFVHDESVQDGEELVSTEAEIKRNYFRTLCGRYSFKG